MRLHDQLGRHARHRGHRRGREGQRADALQRRGGRRRHRPRVRRRGRPDRRHHADRQGHEQRHRRARRRPAAPMFDPSAVFYMEKLVTGPEAADVVDIRKPVAENIHQVAKAKGMHRARRHRRAARPAPPRRPRRGDPRHRRAHQVHPRRRRRRRDHGRPPGHRHRPAARRRRHARGHHRGVRDEVHWAASSRPGSGRRTTRSGSGPSTPATTSTPTTSSPPTTWSRGDDCFFVATGITDGELMRGVRYRAGGATYPLAGDALAQRHDPRRSPAEHRFEKLREFAESTTSAAVDFERPLRRSRARRPRGAALSDGDERLDLALTRGSKARPAWEAVTSTGSASGSMQARQSTMPSRLE